MKQLTQQIRTYFRRCNQLPRTLSLIIAGIGMLVAKLLGFEAGTLAGLVAALVIAGLICAIVIAMNDRQAKPVPVPINRSKQ